VLSGNLPDSSSSASETTLTGRQVADLNGQVARSTRNRAPILIK